MEKRRFFIVALFSCLVFTACASGGNPSVTNQSLVDQIKVDKSTKDDVKRLLGQPTTISRHSGNYAIPGIVPFNMFTNVETWGYTHVDVDVDGATFIPIVGLFAGGATSRVNSLTIVFDDKGVVRHIMSSQTQSRSGMGASSGQ